MKNPLYLLKLDKFAALKYNFFCIFVHRRGCCFFKSMDDTGKIFKLGEKEVQYGYYKRFYFRRISDVFGRSSAFCRKVYKITSVKKSI